MNTRLSWSYGYSSPALRLICTSSSMERNIYIYCSSGVPECPLLYRSRELSHHPWYRYFPTRFEFKSAKAGPQTWLIRCKSHRTNIAVYNALRVNICQSTCSLKRYVQAIHVRITTHILENVPITIIWSRDSGHNESCRGHGCRPSGRYVLMIVANSGPGGL